MARVRVGGVRSRRRATDAVQEALFEVVVRPELRYYRQIMDMLGRSGLGSDPLESETVVSNLFGTVWAGQQRRDGELEEAFGLGLVDYVRQRHTPLALALLRTVTAVAPIREVRAAAADAAGVLAGAGLPESRLVGAPRLGRCWAFADVFGDQSTVVCEFGYPDAPPHATVVSVDHALFGVATDVMLTTEVEPLVRDMTNDAQNSAGTLTLRLADPAWARAVLGRAFARTDLIEGIVVEPTFAGLRALALARLDLLPEDATALPSVGPQAVAEHLVAAFLAASSLPRSADIEAAARCVAEYAVRYRPDDPLRVGPATWETFADEWLPQRPAEPTAVASVVRAWSAWVGRQVNLPEAATAELTAALDELFP